MAPPRGQFITLEGIEGAGKSTQLATVCSELQRAGIVPVVTREPGGAPMAEQIRAMLLDPASQGMTSDAELLLMFAARAEHIHRTIEPALAAGRWVLCDRFTDATYAYQGGGRGVDPARIATLEDLVQGGLRPNLTLLFDVSAEIGLARAKGRAALDRFESESIAFFTRARDAYLAIAEREPIRVRIIDAGQPLPAVSTTVSDLLRSYLAAEGQRAR